MYQRTTAMCHRGKDPFLTPEEGELIFKEWYDQAVPFRRSPCVAMDGLRVIANGDYNEDYMDGLPVISLATRMHESRL